MPVEEKNYTFSSYSGQLLVGTPVTQTTTATPLTSFEHVTGQKAYELRNHLGNVLVVVSDARKPINGTGSLSGIVISYSAMVVSATDYSAFGAPMVGRTFSSSSYKYGFNGKLKDDEMHNNSGDSYDFGARMYDARLGRFLSIDPLTMSYPQNTPYSFADNSPIQFIDYNGEAPGDPITPGQVRDKLNDGKTVKSYSVTLYVDQPVHGSDVVFAAPTNVGHAFISITKYNTDGTMTTANFGWYPADENNAIVEGSPCNPTAPGTLKDDSGHPYDAAISNNQVTQQQVNGILDYVDTYKGQEYNLSNNNCIDFAAPAAQMVGLNVPLTTDVIPGCPGTFQTTTGYTPGQLGQDILNGKADQQPAYCAASKPSEEQKAYNFTTTGMTYDTATNKVQRIANTAPAPATPAPAPTKAPN